MECGTSTVMPGLEQAVGDCGAQCLSGVLRTRWSAHRDDHALDEVLVELYQGSPGVTDLASNPKHLAGYGGKSGHHSGHGSAGAIAGR